MTAFRDAFIEYGAALALPPVVISSDASLRSPAVALTDFVVTNHAAFDCTARITGAPEWLLCGDIAEPLAPGGSATLRVGIDPRLVPPGETDARALLTISGPFLRRSYPLHVHASVRYTGPAPRVESETVAGVAGKRTLHVTVTNVGGGLLQGYWHDRNAPRRNEFLLGENESVRFSKTFPDEERGGLAVVCDCVNARLRMHEIAPEREPPFTAAPFIDFLETPRGTRRTFELELRDDFTAIELPERLRGSVTFERLPEHRVRFALASAHPASCADYVLFHHRAGVRRALPILISEGSS